MSNNTLNGLNTRQALVRDFLIAMIPMIGEKHGKVASAQYFADQVLADKPQKGPDYEGKVRIGTSTYRTTEPGAMRAIRKESHDNIARQEY